MKIRIIRPYKDTLLDRHTKINEIIEVTPNRLKELQERVPTFIEVLEEDKTTKLAQQTIIEVPIEIEEGIKEEKETIEHEEPIRETQTLPKKKRKR